MRDLGYLILMIWAMTLTGCLTQNKHPPIGLKTGAYYFYHMGHESILLLKEDGKFDYQYIDTNPSDTIPLQHQSNGRYVIEGTNLWLEYEVAEKGYIRADQPMLIIWWGNRCYLVQPWRKKEFLVSAVTHRWPLKDGGRKIPRNLREPRKTKFGWMYLHEGDWLLPVKGKPKLPPQNTSSPTEKKADDGSVELIPSPFLHE